MYKKVVTELVKSEPVVINVRLLDGGSFTVDVKLADTIKAIKHQIWNGVSNNMKMNVGLDMVNFMEQFVKTSDISYRDFCNHTDDEQVELLAKSGKLYTAFWDFYILIYRGHILEDEATVVGIGFASLEPISIFPREPVTKNESIFLHLFMRIKTLHPEIEIGINDLHGAPYGLPIISKTKEYHSHESPEEAEQCEYELRLFRTMLLPALAKLVIGEESAMPFCCPNLIPLYDKMNDYKHSSEVLHDLHQILNEYFVGIVLHLSNSVPGERMANRFEAEKRTAVHDSLTQVTKKFEAGIIDVEGTESLWYPIYVGPARSFTHYNYTLAQPTLKLSGLNTMTTISDLIESYQHHTHNQGQKMKYLMYNQEKHQPDELIKDIIYSKLEKHFFYFHIEIEDDGRDINELVDFIGGACASPATKSRKKRRKSKQPLPVRPKTLALQKVEVTEQPVIPSDTPTTTPAETPTEAPVARERHPSSARRDEIVTPDNHKNIEQGWKDYIEKKSYPGNAVFAVGRELDFDITEEDDQGARGMTLEKAEYLDRLSGMIASRAQAEWENKKDDFEKLQREQEEIEMEIQTKEVLLGENENKVNELMEMKAKEIEKFSGLVANIKSEKQEGLKLIDNFGKDIQNLESKILLVEQEKLKLNEKVEQTEDKIEKIEKKRRKLEKHIELEMEKMKTEGEKIQDNIEQLGKTLSENYRKAENLATHEAAKPVVQPKPKENTSRVTDFLVRSIKEKEADLECPICFETANIPIFMCSEMHLICNRCRPKIKDCPECRLPYTGQPKRHKFAEKTAGELEKLKKELENLTD